MSARPVWAEVSRSNLLHNFRLLRDLAAPADLLAVVKGNAYGHGAVECARALADAGTNWLGVTDAAEGALVRAACPDAQILVLVGLWPGETEAALKYRLTPVIWQREHLEEAARPGAAIAVHLEIDTGMSRQGVRLEDLPALLDRFQALPLLRLQGVMTHFHSPEMRESPATAEQMERFAIALEMIAAQGFRPEWIDAGNSASLLEPGPDWLLTLAAKHGAKAMLRPGLALYGYAPRFIGGAQPNAAAELKTVLAWKTRISSLRWIDAGETAGYCATFRAGRRTRLALLAVGYADGLNRLLSNKGAVLVRGQRAPIAGRVSMDMTIVDVTDIPEVEIGDEIVLIGAQGAERITAYEQADLTGTIPYEIICNINTRVPRTMVD